MRKLLKFIPEIYFMGLGIFCAAENYFAGGIINYIALLLVWLLFLQLFYKNRILGLVYGALLGSVSVYMILATNSQVAKFDELTPQVVQMQVVGWGIFGAGVFMACMMVYRFAMRKDNYNEESVLTVTY